MITLICTKCKATLEMDDAFAGGVCRCQYCGTIQTVPSHLKRQSRPASPTAATQKALYSGAGTAGAGLPSSGLDELASVVASSGLSSGLGHGRPTGAGGAAAAGAGAGAGQAGGSVSYAPVRPAAGGNKTLLLVAGGAGGALVLVLILFLAFGRSSSDTPTPTANTPGGTGSTKTPVVAPPVVKKPAGPHFMTVDLSAAKKVAIVMDCSGGHREIFSQMSYELERSVRSLRPDQQFQVLLWTEVNSGTGQAKERWFPENGTLPATPANVEQCVKQFADFSATGQTAVGPAVTRALKSNPDVVVVATGKGILMGGDVASTLRSALAGKRVTLHTVDLSQSGDGRNELEPVSKDSGGTYSSVPGAQVPGN